MLCEVSLIINLNLITL